MKPHRNLLAGVANIAGFDAKSLSNNQLAAMKMDLQGQISARRSEIETMRAATDNGYIDQAVWSEFESWRKRTAGLINIIDKELLLRKDERKSSDDSSHSDKNRLFQISQLASFLMADRILDAADDRHLLTAADFAEAAKDSVILARTCVDEVWRALDKEKT